MKHCTVHFGMPKTGSSSIQQTLFHAPADKLPFTYVRLPGEPANLTRIVLAIWLDDPSKFHLNRKLGLTLSQTDAKRKELRRSLTECVLKIEGNSLISAEGLSNLSQTGLMGFKDWLHQHAVSIQAVGYIRPPKAFLESAFPERLKGATISRMQLGKIFLPYRRRFEKFDLVFGPRNVQFWKFDPSDFTGGDVVQDFCAHLGFSIQSKYLCRRNEALSLNAVRLLFAYRRFGPGFGTGQAMVTANNRLLKRLSQLPGPKLRFAENLIHPILEKHRTEIVWMEERLGASLQEDFVDTPDTVHSENDLLKFDEESLRWLGEQLGSSHMRRLHSTMSPQEVAAWMHELRLKLTLAR